MSFTQAEHLFAGMHETGINDIFKAFFTARSRHRLYATSNYVTLPPASQTNIPPITIALPDPQHPILIIQIFFEVEFTIPVVDINPNTTTPPSVFILNPPQIGMAGEFSVMTTLHVKHLNVFFNFPPFTIPIPPIPPITVYGRCEPVVANFNGAGAIGIKVKQAKVVIPLLPPWLQPYLDLIMFFILKAIFKNVIIPFDTVMLGEFGLILQVGPYAEQHQFKVRGSAL